MNAVDTRPAARVSRTPGPIRSLARLWIIGTGLAVLFVTSVYFVADAVAGPLVVAGAGEVTLSNVVGFTLLGSTVGAALAYVIGRLARRPRLTFVAVALTALAGYAVVPFTAAESPETAIWLNALHVVVAIPVITMLKRYLAKDRTLVGE